MEIRFDNKSIKSFKEVFNQTKIIQEIAESVVPDTDDDIAELASVQSAVLLKSKDITNRGVLVTGEICASLMYISESQDKVSHIKLRKNFSMEYEISDISPETMTRIRLFLISSEPRLINPRKVSVSFELAGELCGYAPEDLSVEYGVPADSCPGLHAKYESREINLISNVCEKTFSINEQFNFPSGKPRPDRLIYADADLVINDTQFIGTKVIVKGSADVSVYYASDEVNYPLKTEFNTLFSQIIDIGDNAASICNIVPELTAIYYDMAESIGGEKIADIELHAVLQTVCRSSREIVYISDAYCNLMPAECYREKRSINVLSENRKLKISADEHLDMGEGCVDILNVLVSDAYLSQSKGEIKLSVSIDVLYRNQSSKLSSARRCVSMQTESPAENFRVSNIKLSDIYFRPDGQYLDCHLTTEIECTILNVIELEMISSVQLNEEERIELDAYPTLTLVRCSGESPWELAKTYHSSVEKIYASNVIDSDINGKMILIPKCI